MQTAQASNSFDEMEPSSLASAEEKQLSILIPVLRSPLFMPFCAYLTDTVGETDTSDFKHRLKPAARPSSLPSTRLVQLVASSADSSNELAADVTDSAGTNAA